MLQAAVSPKKINLRKESNLLELNWSNGQLSSLSGDKLRQFCACSLCRSRDVVGQQLVNESGQITALHLMGSTGIQIIFEDGHDRGIFPWGYLQAIAEGNALSYLEN